MDHPVSMGGGDRRGTTGSRTELGNFGSRQRAPVHRLAWILGRRVI